jgi:hypothetical protein
MTKAKQQQLISRTIACLSALERKEKDNYLSKLPRGLSTLLTKVCQVIDDSLDTK